MNSSFIFNWLLCWYLVASLFTFGVYVRDKGAAKALRWRTRESTLHVLSLVGGWPGAWVAQRVIRHKSRKATFRIVFWSTVIVNCALLTLFVFR